MGYDATNTAPMQVGQVQGVVQVRRATVPTKAHVVGLDAIEFELQPTFVPGSRAVLWGRTDFMRIFPLLVEEAQQRFTLVLPTATPQA